MNSFLLALAWSNLAAAAAILLVMALRKIVRRAFGARLAYGLWLLPPAAALAALTPVRQEIVQVAAPAAGERTSTLVLITQSSSGFDPMPILAVLWVIGAATAAVWLARKQFEFVAEARRGRAGPAVVGVIRPRIVTPADFGDQFTAREQDVILTHERTHIARRDTVANGLVALVRCICWFNPLIHLGAFLMCIDQELACDAEVVERHPKARRVYAAAMLKAETADRPLPLGCYWPAGAGHPLMERIALLKSNPPSTVHRLAGAVCIGLLCASAAAGAWAARPAHVVRQTVATPNRTLDQSALTPRGGSSSSVPAARLLRPDAVPSNPEGETSMRTQKTRRLAGAVVAAVGLGAGAATVADAQPAQSGLTNSQRPAAAAPTHEELDRFELIGGEAAPGAVVVMRSARRESDVAAPVDAARQAALDAALGLPAGSQKALTCKMIVRRTDGGGEPTPSSSCSVAVNGGAPTEIPPELVAKLREEGLIGGPARAFVRVPRAGE